MVILIIMMLHETSHAKHSTHLCSSSCGNIHNITFPFRLTTDPLSCGDLRYNLSCENNITVLYLSLKVYGQYFEYQRHYVQAINYNNYTIRLVDPSIHKDDCSSTPNYTLSEYYFNIGGVHSYEAEIRSGLLYYLKRAYNAESKFEKTRQLLNTLIFFNCESPVLKSSHIDASPCLFNGTFSSSVTSFHSRRKYYSYYYVLKGDDEFNPRESEEACWIQQTTVIKKWETDWIKTADDIRNALIYGFELSWVQSFSRGRGGLCYIVDENSNRVGCVSSCPPLADDRVEIYGCGKNDSSYFRNVKILN
ncbi:Wall-associated receptor kinase, galacturonan-binding domain containing protein [Parasponia andersonii]|uniref:Wall-associated receptor kinase, galacturonan-binding domain containing protein n=1 Tax=Parasponia andersonii TaxID=3476 RepID=A0A2P5AS51_PARAD|nr:Wall-associated receptor kinase, galacturonan-binding domain containing protein [Parasponia andersonii]